jgi:hypothetical protein
MRHPVFDAGEVGEIRVRAVATLAARQPEAGGQREAQPEAHEVAHASTPRSAPPQGRSRTPAERVPDELKQNKVDES